MQLLFVQPVLLHAELYESGELVHFGAASEVPARFAGAGFDLMRDVLSVLVTALVYTGYAFLMVAAMALAEQRGHRVGLRHGLIWGFAGFVAVHLAPGFGLPPELPGVSAAEVLPRQIWWFATAGAAAVALWLIAFGNGVTAWGAAIVLLLAPHLVGAPQPDVFLGPAPPELGGLFAARSLGVALAGWSLLGLATAWFWSREAA